MLKYLLSAVYRKCQDWIYVQIFAIYWEPKKSTLSFFYIMCRNYRNWVFFQIFGVCWVSNCYCLFSKRIEFLLLNICNQMSVEIEFIFKICIEYRNLIDHQIFAVNRKSKISKFKMTSIFAFSWILKIINFETEFVSKYFC